MPFQLINSAFSRKKYIFGATSLVENTVDIKLNTEDLLRLLFARMDGKCYTNLTEETALQVAERTPFEAKWSMQGFTMVRCIQGAKTLSLPMQMLGADLQAHKVNYNNNPILKWCLTNTGIHTDRNGNIVPIKNQSPQQRIDGTAALLDCYVGLYEHYNEYTGAI